MTTRNSRTPGDGAAGRRHVGLTLPRTVKAAAGEAASVLGWSVGDWILAAAAEHGPRLRSMIGTKPLGRRASVEDATFTAIYLTLEEREELDDQAVACGLNRSAFVTAVARLGVGEELDDVISDLRRGAKGPP